MGEKPRGKTTWEKNHVVLREISEKIPDQVFSNSRKYFVTNILGGHDDLTQCRYMSVRPSVRPSALREKLAEKARGGKNQIFHGPSFHAMTT